MRWNVHGTRVVYDSPWVRVRLDDVELPSGTHIDHHVVEFPKPSVGAVVTDDLGRMLLLWRHRHITDASGWEIPAGWAEPGEDLAEAAAREVEEETGYRPASMQRLMVYHPLSGISTMTYTVFHGTKITKIGMPELEETERVDWLTATEVRKLLSAGSIVDGPSLTAVSYYLALLGSE